MRKILRPLAAALLPLALAAAGCGSDDRSPGSLSVVASTGIAADITESIGGDDVEVTQLIPDSVSPHDFQPSAQDRQTIADADLVVEFGQGLEAAVPTDRAAASIAIADHAGQLREAAHEHDEEEHADEEHADEEHADEGNQEHGGDEHDPHVWMDPIRIANAAPALAAALADVDPANANAYEARGREYAQQLRALDREIAGLIAAIPRTDRKLVTSHDVLGYFADRYGFEVLATPFGLSPEAEASANDISAVIDVVEREAVPAVFVEQGDDPQVLERVAEATGVAVIDDLLIEGFGPGVSSYEQMLRFTARRITDALAA